MPAKRQLDEPLVAFPSRVLPRSIAALRRLATKRGGSIAEALDHLLKRARLYEPGEVDE